LTFIYLLCYYVNQSVVTDNIIKKGSYLYEIVKTK